MVTIHRTLRNDTKVSRKTAWRLVGWPALAATVALPQSVAAQQATSPVFTRDVATWFKPVVETGLTESRWVRAIEIRPATVKGTRGRSFWTGRAGNQKHAGTV